MNQQPSNFNTRLEKVMSPEQFAEVIEAILNGKYSWACVLILRFAGYNPLHYIPYRTYNRIIKENYPIKNQRRHKTSSTTTSSKYHKSSSISSQQSLDRIDDLAYLEAVEEQTIQIHGGGRCQNHVSHKENQVKDRFRSLKKKVFSFLSYK